MTDEHIKEQLSKHFIGIMAAFKGIDVAKPERDYGVDLRLEKIHTYQMMGKTRYSSAGKAVDVQLKATSQKKTSGKREGLVFDLEVENFNDLVQRRKDLTSTVGGHTPLVLIVLVMQKNKKEWVKKEDGELTLRGKAFWFYPSLEIEMSKRKNTKRIFIPLENEVNLPFFDFVFNLFPNSIK